MAAIVNANANDCQYRYVSKRYCIDYVETLPKYAQIGRGDLWRGLVDREREVKRITDLSAAGALVGVFLVSGCGNSGSGATGAAAAPSQRRHGASRSRVKDWDEFTGRLQAVETVEIRPRVSGYIDKVAFTEGSLVKRGDLLFVIDPRPYQADYDRAAADVKRFKTALDLARIESARVQRLKDSGAVSQEELDERKSTVAQAEANVGGRAGRARVGRAQLEFHQGHEPDRRARQPRRSDARQSGHRRQQRRHAC